MNAPAPRTSSTRLRRPGAARAGTRLAAAALVALGATALAGCIQRDKHADDAGWVRDMNLGHGALAFDDGAVVVKREGSKARIAASGDLTIDGRAVAVDAGQRAQLVAYHQAAFAMRGHAIDTAKAGVDVGKAVVGEVLHGIAKGDTSNVEKVAEAKAEGVKRVALTLCDDLDAIRGAQDRLAATLPDFKPFVLVQASEIDDCRKDLRPEPGSTMAGAGAPEPPANGPSGAPVPEAPSGAPAGPAAPSGSTRPAAGT